MGGSFGHLRYSVRRRPGFRERNQFDFVDENQKPFLKGMCQSAGLRGKVVLLDGGREVLRLEPHGVRRPSTWVHQAGSDQPIGKIIGTPNDDTFRNRHVVLDAQDLEIGYVEHPDRREIPEAGDGVFYPWLYTATIHGVTAATFQTNGESLARMQVDCEILAGGSWDTRMPMAVAVLLVQGWMAQPIPNIAW